MWKRLISPEILFTFASVSAVLPYLYFQAATENALRDYATNLTYIPLVLWAIALLAFLIGSLSASFILRPLLTASQYKAPRFALSNRKVTYMLGLVEVLAVIQIYFAIQFLGVIPLLAFSGGYNVEDLHEHLTDSPSGQFGLLTLTSFILTSVVICLLGSRKEWPRSTRLLAGLSLVTAAFIGLFLGKAQGFVVQLSLLLSASILIAGHPLNPLLTRFGIRSLSGRGTALVFAIVIMLVVFIFGITRSLRLGDETLVLAGLGVGLEFALRYLSWPLLNTEEIVQQQGVFGDRADFENFFVGLLPYKLAERDDYFLSILAEPSSPVGLVGHVYWYSGILGLVGYCLILGFFMKAIFRNTTGSVAALLIYAQACWGLAAANTYNHFVTLIFFPLPAVLYLLIARVLAKSRSPAPILKEAVAHSPLNRGL